MKLDTIDWKKSDGLVPAIVQDANTGQVLMLGYMNEAALQQSISSQQVTFYSRSKQRLWVKGESSGNHLTLVDILLDCDNDSLLVMAKPAGPTCHKGTTACFSNDKPSWNILQQLENTIQQRAQADTDDSYTAQLLNQGIDKISQKVGEEAVETVVAALKESNERVCSESADLLYHWLVMLHARDLSINDVLKVLHKRAQA